MPEFTFTKLNFLDMLKLTSLKSILKIKGIQGVPEYLLKVKRGGLDHHYSKKKSHFFNPFLNIDLKAFSLLFYLGVFCVCSFQKNLLNFFGCKRIILSPIEHFLLASKSLIAWCKYSQKGNFMLKLKLKTP